MARDYDTLSGQVETLVPFVRGGVTKKDTSCGTGSELVASRGSHVWVAETPKNLEVRVVWRGVVEQRVGDNIADSRAWAPIEQVGCRGKSLSPLGRGHVRMDQHGPDDVVQCAKNMLGLAILRRRVGTRET